MWAAIMKVLPLVLQMLGNKDQSSTQSSPIVQSGKSGVDTDTQTNTQSQSSKGSGVGSAVMSMIPQLLSMSQGQNKEQNPIFQSQPQQPTQQQPLSSYSKRRLGYQTAIDEMLRQQRGF